MRFLLSVVVAGILAAAGCTADPTSCAICHMPIPDQTRAVVRVDDGTSEAVCDARCPLTYQQDTGKKVELLEVTDYTTGDRLYPGSAFFVTGSDVAPDAHTQALRTTAADTAYLHWHRCLPSVLAFGNRTSALAFQAEHGGTVMTLADLGFTGNR